MSIRASVSSRDITPKGEVRLVGYPGAKRSSTGIGDPLLSSAIHLRGGSGGIIIISLDLLHLDPSRTSQIRRRVFEATGTKEQNVFVVTTQNHSGPPASTSLHLLNDASYAEPDEAYLDTVVQESVLAASEAAVATCPASVATVPLDRPNTGMFVVKSDKGRVIGLVIVNDQVPAILGAADTRISADFMAALRQKLSAKLGAGLVVTYIVAPSADRFFSGSVDEAGPDAATRAGETLAATVISKIRTLTATDFASNIEMSGRLLHADGLPQKTLPTFTDAVSALSSTTNQEAALRRASAPQDQLDAARWAALDARRTMSFVAAAQRGMLAKVEQDIRKVTFQILNIGKMRILGIPGSITRECGLKISELVGGRVWLTECFDGNLQGSLLSYNGAQRMPFRLLSGLFKPDVGYILADNAVLCATNQHARIQPADG